MDACADAAASVDATCASKPDIRRSAGEPVTTVVACAANPALQAGPGTPFPDPPSVRGPATGLTDARACITAAAAATIRVTVWPSDPTVWPTDVTVGQGGGTACPTGATAWPTGATVCPTDATVLVTVCVADTTV
jgi:hypothetical protein